MLLHVVCPGHEMVIRAISAFLCVALFSASTFTCKYAVGTCINRHVVVCSVLNDRGSETQNDSVEATQNIKTRNTVKAAVCKITLVNSEFCLGAVQMNLTFLRFCNT